MNARKIPKGHYLETTSALDRFKETKKRDKTVLVVVQDGYCVEGDTKKLTDGRPLRWCIKPTCKLMSTPVIFLKLYQVETYISCLSLFSMLLRHNTFNYAKKCLTGPKRKGLIKDLWLSLKIFLFIHLELIFHLP